MAFGIGRDLVALLLGINSVLYLVSCCLAGWAQNVNFDSQNRLGQNDIGDQITTWFLPIALIASVVGLASVLAGFRHMYILNGDSLATAAATSFIAWLLILLAMGFAAKEIDASLGYRPGKLKILEAFIILQSLTELLYLLSLHQPGFGSGILGSGHIHNHNHNPNCSMSGQNCIGGQGGAGHSGHHHHQHSGSGHSMIGLRPC